MEIRSEGIFELCDTINQPIFIQRNEKKQPGAYVPQILQAATL